MGRTGTNNGGGARWADMPRGTCPKCGLTRPVGVHQGDRGFVCTRPSKCEARAEKKRAQAAAVWAVEVQVSDTEWVRTNGRWATKDGAKGWMSFVKKAWHGRPTRVVMVERKPTHGGS